uniref:Uncharacterized protein n=1 Tax=Cacopsylla melanoneura TaxID=428564 RepID=A0A8D8TSK1_9HEMI
MKTAYNACNQFHHFTNGSYIAIPFLGSLITYKSYKTYKAVETFCHSIAKDLNPMNKTLSASYNALLTFFFHGTRRPKCVKTVEYMFWTKAKIRGRRKTDFS